MSANKCPDWYLMSDGSQFSDFSHENIAPVCQGLGLSHWDTHCLLSAAEHYFRMGAKPGETETDREACEWWTNQTSKAGSLAWGIVREIVRKERAKLNR